MHKKARKRSSADATKRAGREAVGNGGREKKVVRKDLDSSDNNKNKQRRKRRLLGTNVKLGRFPRG